MDSERVVYSIIGVFIARGLPTGGSTQERVLTEEGKVCGLSIGLLSTRSKRRRGVDTLFCRSERR